ncbi:hypothetical protein [Oenococcus sp.]|uniref:hypothetical protein n=1 Tax=Oenococcus sp. TaxID=1979414 RepID=UPI0039EB3245
MIGHVKKLIMFASGMIFLVVLFSLFFYLYNQPNSQLARRDAAIIYRRALTNRLDSAYIYSGRPVNKSDYIHSIQINLGRNLVLSPSLTYKKIHYQRQAVLHDIAGKMYRLQFSKRPVSLGRILLNNTHTARVDYQVQKIDLGRILDHLISLSENDLTKAQRSPRLSNLSQSQIALLQYILISNNWRHYIATYNGKAPIVRSSFTMVFDPRKKRFVIDRKTLQLIQSSGVSDE